MNPINKSILEKNDLILTTFSFLLNENPRYFTKEDVESFSEECHLPINDAYAVLIANLFQFDLEKRKNDYIFYNEYLKPSLHLLDVNDYLNNDYYQNIKPSNTKYKNWEIKKQVFEPYELFVQDKFIYDDNFKTLPNIGYFNETYEYLSVLENGVEWMTITPNEINTMKDPINKAFGKVLTCGLGLGYFAYMASNKDNVEEVTIIEKDEKIIDLFNNVILPLFKNQDKIKIICSDAVEYLKGDLSNYDYIFVDLWHDASDGLEFYQQLLPIEKNNKTIKKIDYWIEDMILNYYKWSYYHDHNGKISDLNLEDFKDNLLFKKYLINKL